MTLKSMVFAATVASNYKVLPDPHEMIEVP